MITLAIETSTNSGSIALLDDTRILLSEEFAADRSLGSLLFGKVHKAVQIAPRIDLIAVGLGPGSYSGVRIAISTAMGLSISTGACLVGVSSPAAIATGASSYFAIGDARRNTYYFASVCNRECVEGPMLLAPEELSKRLSNLSVPVFASTLINEFPQAQIALPSAEIVGILAIEGKSVIATGDLEPVYMRDPHITMPKAV